MKKRRDVCIWGLAAIIAVVLAIAFSSTNSSASSLFSRTNKAANSKSCNCSQDTHINSGIVEDCCCDYETVDHVNEEVLHPLLQELIKTPLFGYFKVKLWCDCPFWPDDGMCRLRDCSICECPENEFPETFKKPFSRGLSPNDLICQEGKPEAAVDRTIDTNLSKDG